MSALGCGGIFNDQGHSVANSLVSVPAKAFRKSANM